MNSITGGMSDITSSIVIVKSSLEKEINFFSWKFNIFLKNTLQALATQGWMMYYASSLTVLGGLHNTPLRSLMSKIVEPTEFGKIFTLTGVAQSISTLITGSFFQEIYVETEASFPGLMYLIGAGIQFLILVD